MEETSLIFYDLEIILFIFQTIDGDREKEGWLMSCNLKILFRDFYTTISSTYFRWNYRIFRYIPQSSKKVTLLNNTVWR